MVESTFHMHAMRRVVSNFAWLTAATLVAQLVGAAALLYVARRVGPGVFGALAFVQAIANLGFVVGDMGLGRLGTKLVSTGAGVGSAADIVCLRVCLNLAVLAAMVGMILATGIARDQELLLILTALATTTLALAPDFVWTGMQAMRMYSGIQTIQLGLRAGAIIVLVALTGSVMSVPIATMVAGVIGALLMWAMLPHFAKHATGIHPGRWLEYLGTAIPIGLAAMMPNVYLNSDAIMVRGFLGLHMLAQYAAAYRILLVPLTVAGLFVTALFPALCRIGPTSQEARFLVRRALSLGVGAALVIACVGTFASTQLMELLYGSAYRVAGSAFGVLILVPVVAIPALILSSAMVAAGHTRFNLLAIVGGGLVNLGLDAVLLPVFGIRGGGLATLAAESTVLAAMWVRWTWSCQRSWRMVTAGKAG